MKRWMSVLFTALCAVGFVLGAATVTAGAESARSMLITESHATYKDGNFYSGKQSASHIDVGEFATLTVSDDGGSHTDGKGNKVFSNYAVFRVDLNFNPLTKEIGSTGVKVSRDTCDWNKTPFAQAGDTEQYIAYGAICATRTDGYGRVFHYEPMFSKGNTSVENLVFNEDGDYTVYVLFETVKNGKYQNHVLSWSFRIRSYIYIVDDETGFPIKESGISGKPIRVDSAGRKKTDIECVFVSADGSASDFSVGDGTVLFHDGTYRFTVRSNGFISELFDFSLDTADPSSKLFFANLRKQLGDNSYEAEEYFYFTWTESAVNPITVTYDYYDYTSEDPTTHTYQKETVLDQTGLYHIYARMKTHTVEYLIRVVEGDEPSQNYEVLSGKRFNNFKTKWYQVYDSRNGRYLCFDMDEYDKAYEAAMTVENNEVNSSNGRLYYRGSWYADRIDLTAAMHEYATANNIQIVYYDPSDYDSSEESERTFSPNAFDGTVYLNDDFQFVTSHPSETQKVTATDEYGRVYNRIEYFVPIGDQTRQIPHGKYTVSETDMYGNETTYSVYRDKRAPDLVLITDGGETIIPENGKPCVANGYFKIGLFYDTLDDYAVLKITKPDAGTVYFYREEYLGIVFDRKGVYTVCAYDRNHNMLTFDITVR